MRYRLRTLMIVLALMPPLLACGWFGVREWQRQRAQTIEEEKLGLDLKALGLRR